MFSNFICDGLLVHWFGTSNLPLHRRVCDAIPMLLIGSPVKFGIAAPDHSPAS